MEFPIYLGMFMTTLGSLMHMSGKTWEKPGLSLALIGIMIMLSQITILLVRVLSHLPK